MIFFKWVCFSFQFGKQHIDNLFSDLQDGKRLLDLLEGLTGQKLVRIILYFLPCLRASFLLPSLPLSFSLLLPSSISLPLSPFSCICMWDWMHVCMWVYKHLCACVLCEGKRLTLDSFLNYSLLYVLRQSLIWTRPHQFSYSI